MLRLLELVLACLGGWDTARRLIPVRVPVVVAELSCAGLGFVLLTWADTRIMLSLCVPGGLMVLATVVSPSSHIPWGPQVMEAYRLYRHRHQGMRAAAPVSKIGNRVPRL